MKIKFNWGTGILITFILFMTSVLLQVFYYMNTDVDLVTDNYYEKELSYEEHITKIRNSSGDGGKVDLLYTNEIVDIKFPDVYDNNSIKGTILFYRASDRSKDFVLPITADTNCSQQIAVNDIDPGYWKIKIDWAYLNNLYYFEKDLLLE